MSRYCCASNNRSLASSGASDSNCSTCILKLPHSLSKSRGGHIATPGARNVVNSSIRLRSRVIALVVLASNFGGNREREDSILSIEPRKDRNDQEYVPILRKLLSDARQQLSNAMSPQMLRDRVERLGGHGCKPLPLRVALHLFGPHGYAEG
jgi:hypothetical protein